MNKMDISAKIITDSIANGVRLTTMELNYPRFIHAEAKTHRIISLDDEEYELILKQDVDLMDDPMLSRNASSSRAIPVEKMMLQVLDTPATPISWGKNKPGMQADITLDEWGKSTCKNIWLNASRDAIKSAKYLAEQGLHKQIVNRLLEPFQYIKVIVTATEWDNFFKLRLHKDAQPEIALLASKMREAMDGSTPTKLIAGEWHLPYVPNSIQEEGLWDGLESDCPVFNYEKAIKCSVARCARVSYLNHDTSKPNVEKDIALADKLLEAGHMSPFEHVATPMKNIHYTECEQRWEKGVTHTDRMARQWSGNFRGWIMYRKLLDG